MLAGGFSKLFGSVQPSALLLSPFLYFCVALQYCTYMPFPKRRTQSLNTLYENLYLTPTTKSQTPNPFPCAGNTHGIPVQPKLFQMSLTPIYMIGQMQVAYLPRLLCLTAGTFTRSGCPRYGIYL